MPDEINQIVRRLDTVERNTTDLAKSVTNITEELSDLSKPLRELEVDREVHKERDKNLYSRLDQIETSIENVHNLGWWVLGTFGASAIALIANFMFKGGFYVQ